MRADTAGAGCSTMKGVEHDLVTIFIREAEAVGAGVCRSSQSGLADALARLLEGDRSVVLARGLELLATDLRARGLDVVCEDGPVGAGEAPARADAGVTSALAAVAASGTVLLGPGAGLEGVIATLPPYSVVLLPAEAVVPDLAAALAEAAPLIERAGSRLVFVTGPSRTSDIELTPVIGVHGPLRLDVVIVDG